MKPSFKLDVSLGGGCVKLETEFKIWLLKLKAGKFCSLDVSLSNLGIQFLIF